MPIDVALIGGQRLFVAQHLLEEEIHGIPEKKNHRGGGGGGGVEDMEFSGILKK